MTMSNALPRFGMRPVAALAVVAVAALAALLALGSPASAQSSDDGEEIWSATMTVGDFPIGKGYTPQHGGIGSLSDTTVPVESQVYTVTFLNEGSAPSKQLRIGFNRLLNALDREVLALHVGGQTFDFEDAAYALDADYEHTYSWPHDPLFGWADSDTVAVSITALPVIHMLASPYTVEYGVAGNIDEDATVQFTFYRTGSAKETLSFTISHSESGETATRTFEAGQSSFDNYHIAIDVDESNDPVCSITWVVEPGDGYVRRQGALTSVEVAVEGPGTTCVGGG